MKAHKKLKIKFSYDLAIPLLSIHPDKTIIQKDAYPCVHSSIIIIAKTWKQSKSTDEWINKMWYIYTKKYYSAIKNNKIMPSAAKNGCICCCRWMDLKIIILSEVSQKDKDKYNMISLRYVESKIRHRQTYIEKKDLQNTKNRLVLAKGKEIWY